MNTEEVTAEYHSRSHAFERLRQEALYIIEQSLAETEIKLHSISSRVKTLASLIGKIERKEYGDPFEEIQDFVGIRIICLFTSDIDRIGGILRSFLVAFVVIFITGSLEKKRIRLKV